MIKEAITYFSEYNAYQQLFTLFRKKYESLGRIGGAVKLDSLGEDGLEAVARFFGLTATDLQQKGKVTLESFEKQLKSTKFASIGLKELLEAYFEEPLISKKEKKQLEEQKQGQYFDLLENKFPRLCSWFNHLRKKTPDTYWIYRLITDSPEEFLIKVTYLERAFNRLPSHFERLPLFSQRITRNPHAFDLNTNLGKLFIHLLAVDHYKDDSIVPPADSESINDLLLVYNILRDDITNYVTCANLLAESHDALHPMWQAAAKTHSVMNIPLRELIGLSRIYPIGKKKEVWVVENSGVYSSILDKLPGVPLICTHGQFKLAALLLIDLLAKEDCTFYYAGDIDPEGISMAERLLLRHPENVQLWKMDVPAYRKSEANIELSNERLKKLESIVTPELLPVAEELKQRKRAGYQEALVTEMVDDLDLKYN
ncbi:TIGR02679 family protein [Virgibacillus indicus]|uniref:TIGR02679 family protein n=1 Tax=Virgibacillus indicus TaxID=2024554 RepID=A0A265N6J5_9BACI|nr:TIGR02679 family protein [Virgibacillus indicus]OZU87069.1 TIGR02679 family protein [Virgibacillus indicus]